MPNWKITYKTISGFEDSIIIAAVNKVMAWDIFTDLSQDWEDAPTIVDCIRVLDEEE